MGYRKADNEFKATLEESMHGRRTDALGESLAEFIDPTLLHTESPSLGFENHTTTGLFWEEKNDTLAFFKKLQQSSWADAPSSQSEQNGMENPHQPPEDISGDIWAEPLAIELLINMDSWDGRGITKVQDSGRSFGYAISSGWSSTFFPCGMDDEPQGPRNNMATRSVECERRLL